MLTPCALRPAPRQWPSTHPCCCCHHHHISGHRDPCAIEFKSNMQVAPQRKISGCRTRREGKTRKDTKGGRPRKHKSRYNSCRVTTLPIPFIWGTTTSSRISPNGTSSLAAATMTDHEYTFYRRSDHGATRLLLDSTSVMPRQIGGKTQLAFRAASSSAKSRDSSEYNLETTTTEACLRRRRNRNFFSVGYKSTATDSNVLRLAAMQNLLHASFHSPNPEKKHCTSKRSV